MSEDSKTIARPYRVACALLVFTLLGAHAAAQTQFETGKPQPVVVLRSDFQGKGPGEHTPWQKTSILAQGLGFSGWDLGPGATGLAHYDDVFGFHVTPSTTYSTLAEALAQGDYVGCTITPSAGISLDGARLEIETQRSSYFAPRAYALFSSAVGFTEADALLVTPTVDNGDYDKHRWNVFLPSSGHGPTAGPIEVRVYAFENDSSNHATSLSAFAVTTGIPSVPLTTIVAGGGRVSTTEGRRLYEIGERVEVASLPDAGHRLSSWAGDILGVGSPRTLTMDRGKTVWASFEPLPTPDMEVGTNLDRVVDWSTAWPFIDAFDRTRSWLTSNSDGSGPFDSGFGDQIPLDAQGWPTQVPFTPTGSAIPQYVHTILVKLNEAGNYKFFYEGAGVLQFYLNGKGGTSLPTGGAREHAFTVSNPGSAALQIRIQQSAAPDHLRNFSIVHEKFYAVHANERFHPLFMNRLRNFGHLRFMDWGRTNASKLKTWSERPLPNQYTQAGHLGASIDDAVNLCNRLRKDAWICVPHEADDTYVRSLASFLRSSLHPSLKAYIEYSNETWNTAPGFEQTSYVRAQGLSLGLDTDPVLAGHRYAALRSAQIWTIFREEYGAESETRLVCVLGTQSANLTVTNVRTAALAMTTINPQASQPDALAIAPYFGRTFTGNDVPPVAPAYPTLTEILEVNAPASIAGMLSSVRAQKLVANEQGWDLICYEGGQHYVAVGVAASDPVMLQILFDANSDPRMGLRYEEYLDTLEAEGVSAFCHYTNCGEWNQYGTWGALQVQDEPKSNAPKYAALVDWILSH